MRKYRLLAVIMAAIFMVATLPMIPVQADTIGKEAQACKELGILLGADKSGVTTQYLAAIPTRLQAYIIALRLKGLYSEAGSFTSSNNFRDASLAGWAKNYLAYAKNTPELGWTGYPDGSFGVNDKISGQAFYKVMLETLGYKQNIDFSYARTLEFADKIGLVEDAAEITAIKSFTTNDIAKGIYGALNTNVAGTDKKLVDVLEEKGIFESEKVEAAGFNSLIQISVNMNLEYGIPMIPIKDTYTKMGCYILENDNTNMSYEIKKDSAKVRFTEGYTTAFINNTKVEMERPVMKNKAGVYYVPASFIVASAKTLGYDAEYISSKNILKLQASAVIKAAESEIVLLKGTKKAIKVEKRYSDIDVQDVTSQCTFTAASTGGIVMMGSNSGEVIGNNLGTDKVVVKYMGKEVDRVTAYVVDVVPTHYPLSYYEQVFDTFFRIDKTSCTDAYGAVWNKKSGILATTNENDGKDTGSSLNIKSYSPSEEGVTVDLTKLLENRAIKGKTSVLKIYAKAIAEGSELYVKANIRSSYASINKENTIALGSTWKGVELLKINIPEDTQELTLEIATGQNGEIRVDGFTMTLE